MITTDLALRKVKPPTGGRVELRDKVIPGLFLRVSVSGKVWYLRGRPPGEKNPVAIRMGPYGDGTDAFTIREARMKATEWKQAIKAGDDPRDERRIKKQRANDTFATTVERFLKSHGIKIKPNTKTQYVSILQGKDIAPIAKKPVNKIAGQHIHEIVDQIVASGRLVQANRTLAVLRKFFNWCAEKGVIKEGEHIPTQRIKLPSKERPRSRVLSPDELRVVWRAADRIGWPFGTHVLLLIATGQRQSEAAGITRESVSGGVWRQVDNKAGREHLIPLTKPVMDILMKVPSIPETAHYYLSTTGKRPISGFSKAKKKLDKEIANICKEEALILFNEPWRTHDIRRTVTSGLRKLGVSQETCSRLLNHAAKGVTGRVYDTYDMMPEKTQALITWSNYLEGLICSKADNVVFIGKSE